MSLLEIQYIGAQPSPGEPSSCQCNCGAGIYILSQTLQMEFIYCNPMFVLLIILKNDHISLDSVT